jgi:3-hydroxyisobutyrate dehydrogenase-like beta-hydroxyacid dehydrogenase
MKPRVGFVGLGQMGKWMAINVWKAGFPLTVYDIRPDPVVELVKHGAAGGMNSEDVARQAEVILLSLPDVPEVEEVIFGEKGLAKGLITGSIIVDLSTISYLATVRVEKELRERGVTFIDAPVSGLEARAKTATLTIMVGGDPKAVEKIRPILEVIGNNIVYTGGTGNGQLTKIINNLFYNISVAAMAELLPMAVKLGLDPEAVCQVVNTGTGRTFGLEFFGPPILENKFDVGYPLNKAYKDMANAAEIIARMKIPLPVFSAALETYQLTLAQGWGEEGKGAMIKVWERVLGVEVRKKRSI